ncbi:MAG: hypothetical protein MI922_27185, partial [Bacteroidales bacterium]|nr:hypothetical protein [Bacteroidales bacterium]
MNLWLKYTLLFSILCVACHYSNAQIPLINENHYENYKIEHEITSLLNEAQHHYSIDSLQTASDLIHQAYNKADTIDFYEGLWPACTLIAQLHLENKEYHLALYYTLKAVEISRVIGIPAKTNQNLLFLDTLLYEAEANGVHLDSYRKLYQQNISKYYAIKQKGEKRLLVTILISVVVLIVISVFLGIIIRYGERA